MQRNKLFSNKYLCKENQVQEEEMMGKVFSLIYCCDKFLQKTNNIFVNGKVRYNFQLSHETKFIIPLKVQSYLLKMNHKVTLSFNHSLNIFKRLKQL